LKRRTLISCIREENRRNDRDNILIDADYVEELKEMLTINNSERLLDLGIMMRLVVENQ